jgi:hypothetical protein
VEVLMISPFFSSTMPPGPGPAGAGSTHAAEGQHAAGGVVRHGVLDLDLPVLMRESTISKQGITPSVARSTSAAVTPGPHQVAS